LTFESGPRYPAQSSELTQLQLHPCLKMTAHNAPPEDKRDVEGPPEEERRGFLVGASFAAMLAALGAAYGTFAAYAVRFLFPAGAANGEWQFVSALDEFQVGDAVAFDTPDGAKVVIARQDGGDTEKSFIALSSVCPHLGCKVHWESVNDRFFCPCHNGAFDRQGKPTEGPPAAAGQELTRFPLKTENGLLYIEVPTDTVSIYREES